MNAEQNLKNFLEEFVPIVAKKSTFLNKAAWLLETTGSADAADLKAGLDAELRTIFSDKKTYDVLCSWDKDPAVKDPLLKRQLNVLIRTFKSNLLPQVIIEEISQKEAQLLQTYANFRPEINGKPISENEVREILKKENDSNKRKQAWEASKEIGDVLAPQILHLVSLRNKAARSLGYSDYFCMQLDLQEVDEKWLLCTLENLAHDSDGTYQQIVKEIEQSLSKRFAVDVNELGPWAWGDPFCQEDPIDSAELDSLVADVDICKVSAAFYEKMGINVQDILKRSDMLERPGKNQHAFCIHIDREGDVRTLNNIRPSIKWLETVMHELGHAVYEKGFDPELPWLLREPPHMITTEAMALIAGRQAYRYQSLKSLVGSGNESLLRKAEQRLKRGQLIFSRWVLVMTYFEKELYRDPSQNLNRIWWDAIEKYQKVRRPPGRENKSDWAAKYHIGLAPVYYYSYLLGEMMASAMDEAIKKETGSSELNNSNAGNFLQEKLYRPGNRMRWDQLIEFITGKPLSAQAWIEQFR